MLIKRPFLLLLFIFNLLSCTVFQTDTEKTEDLLPREIELPGWRAAADPKIFNSTNIQKYIKTQEEIRLLDVYEFQELSIAKYCSLSNPDKTITVEIFKMNSSLNAFGILSIQRSDEAMKEEICEDSYSTEQNLFARKNNYYIRIQDVCKYAGAKTDNKLFLKTICIKIKSTMRLPDYLSLFGGKEDRMSLIYMTEGHPKLFKIKNIFSRKTEIEGKTKTIFFAKRNSNNNSLREFSSLLKDNQYILSTASEIQVAFLKTREDNFIFISVYKEWIFGIFDAATMAEGEKTINYLYNNLYKFLMRSGYNN